MKKVSTTIILLSSIVFSAPLLAKPFSQQLEDQKTQLRPQAFNFFEDRYTQIKAQDAVESKSFAAQLASQKLALRPQHFNPKSDAYRQIQAGL
jgi:hypothetical protein